MCPGVWLICLSNEDMWRQTAMDSPTTERQTMGCLHQRRHSLYTLVVWDKYTQIGEIIATDKLQCLTRQKALIL